MTLKFDTVMKMVSLIRKADEEQLLTLNKEIVAQLQYLRRQKAVEVKMRLTPGETRVRIAEGIKPRYLIGLRGLVEEITGDKVTVKLDCGPTNRFRSGRVVFRNASALEVI